MTLLRRLIRRCTRPTIQKTTLRKTTGHDRRRRQDDATRAKDYFFNCPIEMSLQTRHFKL